MTSPQDDIPSIAIESIAEDAAKNDHHRRALSSADLLSPHSSSSLNHPPPSPTLSAKSFARFSGSLALRDNKPEDKPTLSFASWSDTALNHPPPSPITVESIAEDAAKNDHHRRAPSSAGLLSPHSVAVTADDSSSLNHPPSSPTLSSIHFDDLTLSHSHNTTFAGHRTTDSNATTLGEKEHPAGCSKDKKQKSKKGKSEKEDGRTAHELELEQDWGTDPTPFRFRPYQLAHMLGWKDAATLGSLGGTQGILKGLGTNAVTGLSATALATDSGAVAHHAETERVAALEQNKGVGKGASQRHERGSMDKTDVPMSPVSFDEALARDGSVDDRRNIYGSNILPTRRSKSLRELMWLALKDKVLVLLCIAAVISLALGLFQDFGTPRAPGDAPVDWVEGAAIMFAVIIVVNTIIFYTKIVNR